MEQVIHVDAAWRSLNKKQEELCGDRVQIRQNDKCTVMVLADGLGSGVKANILSTLTSTIISEMIFSGMSLKELAVLCNGYGPGLPFSGIAAKGAPPTIQDDVLSI